MWGKFLNFTSGSGSLIDREQFTKDILGYFVGFAAITNIFLWLGTAAGFVNISDTLLGFVMVLVTLPFWYAGKKGGWQWARFFPSLYCFGIGIYSATHGLAASSGLLFIISILLAGMLVSSWFQLFVLVASSLTIIIFPRFQSPVSQSDETILVSIAIFIFIGITIITRYYNLQLHQGLIKKADVYESLIAEMEHSKSTNEALAEKEKQLRRLTENTSDLVAEIKLDGSFIYVSPSYYTVLGYPPGSLLGQSAYSLIHPEDAETTSEAIKRSVENQVGEKARLRTRCANGEYKWFETIGTPLRNQADQVEGFVISSRDITEQKIAEELREKSEKREQSIINSIPLGMHMYELRTDGALIFSGYNPAADHILKFDHSSIIGKTIEEAFPNLIETEIPTKYRETAQYGIPYDVDPVDYQDLHVSGSYEVHAFQISPMKMVTVFNDVSEKHDNAIALKVSEEKFSKAFLTSPDAININRLVDGVYIDINEGFTRLTGWKREDVIGRSSLDVKIWADPTDRVRLVQQLQSEGSCNNLEAGFRFKDGAVKTGMMSAKIIEINGEKCILSVTRDISERKEAQEKLNEAHEQLELAYGETLEGWVHALDLREHETAGHSRRVVEINQTDVSNRKITMRKKKPISIGAPSYTILVRWEYRITYYSNRGH